MFIFNASYLRPWRCRSFSFFMPFLWVFSPTFKCLILQIKKRLKGKWSPFMKQRSHFVILHLKISISCSCHRLEAKASLSLVSPFRSCLDWWRWSCGEDPVQARRESAWSRNGETLDWKSGLNLEQTVVHGVKPTQGCSLLWYHSRTITIRNTRQPVRRLFPSKCSNFCCKLWREHDFQPQQQSINGTQPLSIFLCVCVEKGEGISGRYQGYRGGSSLHFALRGNADP